MTFENVGGEIVTGKCGRVDIISGIFRSGVPYEIRRPISELANLKRKHKLLLSIQAQSRSFSARTQIQLTATARKCQRVTVEKSLRLTPSKITTTTRSKHRGQDAYRASRRADQTDDPGSRLCHFADRRNHDPKGPGRQRYLVLEKRTSAA